MILFRKKWESKDISVRLEWISKADINNSKQLDILEKISKTDKEYLVRKSAFEKLGDNKSALFQVLEYAPEKEKYEVLESIKNDKILLKEIATDCIYAPNEIDLAALRNIEDIDILKDIVLNFYPCRDEIKTEALRIINDDQFLSKLILKDDLELLNINIYEIIEMIKSQTALIKLYNKLTKKKNYTIADVVLKRVEDQNLLKSIVDNLETGNELKITAINNINDVDFLQYVAEQYDLLTLFTLHRLLEINVPVDNFTGVLFESVKRYYDAVYYTETHNYSSNYEFNVLDIISELLENADSDFFKKLIYAIKLPDFLSSEHRFLINKLDKETSNKFGLKLFCSTCNAALSETIHFAYCKKCKKTYCMECIDIETSKFFDDEVTEYSCKGCGKEFKWYQ